ncbi:IS5 family transposase [Candidatus Neomicrothrix sp.]|uniref:IS5 family transposase n=1 Tax=Candidatus Neomicrothrix sp. TaxID=2719034 RepID=UPI0025986DFD|nr:IS5 family transposase [Candidatus Microthrix sp.]HMS48570.1 IS5 family transposase [Candidatus Microthrix sp.]
MADERTYPSDLTDEQWEAVADLFEQRSTMGRPHVHSRRLIVNAILYQARTGCQWRYLPSEFPPRSTVNDCFVAWREDGTWDTVHQRLHNAARAQSGHDPGPGAAVIDAQSVPNAGRAEEVGYDAGKKIRGRKRHIIVDSLGLLIAVLVTSAYVSDIAGGHQLLRKARLTNSMLGIVRADSGYRGLAKRAERLRLKIVIVKNPSRHAFIPVKHRWVVERSLAWLSAYRRLGKRDLEHTTIAAETWIKVASIAMMLARLHPTPNSPQAITWARLW